MCYLYCKETGFKYAFSNAQTTQRKDFSLPDQNIWDGGMTVKRKSDLTFMQKVKRSRTLLLMCLPAVLFFFAFHYMPLPGIWVAFVKYNYRDGIFGSKFVGLDNFKFLASSGKLFSLTKNTILYNLVFILLGNFLAVFVAILLNEMRGKWFKKISQTIMFLPYFISQVLVGFLVYNLLNYDTGFVNGILTNMGMERWQPYADPTVWPALLVVIYLWQQTGYNSVVYFAAIITHGAMAVSAGSKNPERALMVYDLLRNDPVCHMLFCQGVEGVSYEVTDDGLLTKPEGYNADTQNINGITNFWWGRNDDIQLRNAQNNWEKIDELYAEYDKIKIAYPYGQFIVNTDNIQSYIQNITEIHTNYMKQICYGKYSGSAEEIVAEYQNALKAAGIDIVTEELQRQMDAIYN